MTADSLLLITVALGAGAIVKGATGLGLPLVALPVLASFLGVPHAIAILMVPIVVTNVWQIWKLRQSRTGTRFLIPMLGAGMVGIVIGTWILARLPGGLMSFCLGIFLTAYIVLKFARPTFVLSEAMGMRLASPIGLAAGILQGAAGLSAPIAVPFIHAQKLDRNTLVFAVSAMFLILALTQMGTMWAAGLLDTHYLLEGVVALVPVVVFMPLGNWIGGLLSREKFDLLVLALLAGIAINLIVSSLQKGL